MSDPVVSPKSVRFGLFELDLRARELRKSGVKIKLQDQPFLLLAMLLERPGQIVTREERQKRLWPTDMFVVFDLSLNSAVKKLRQALNDDSENPRFIETLYRRGYRFIGPVSRTSLPSPAALGSPEVVPAPQSLSAPPRNLRFLVWAIVAVLVLVIAGNFWPTSPQPPRITGYTQITRDGRPKGFGG